MNFTPYMKLITLLGVVVNLMFASTDIPVEVKEKKMYPMGEKIYKSRCENIDLSNYKSYESLNTAIQKHSLCGDLKPQYAQALSLYLWDVKRVPKKELEKLQVTTKDKCQVCGMYVHHYPTWVTRIKYPKGETYNFDGAKCMFKFYFNNKEGITDILVLDYYTLKTLDARKAFFVIGSDVYGPMGHELIAFHDKKSAQTFYREHKGKQLLHFDEITEYMVRSLGR